MEEQLKKVFSEVFTDKDINENISSESIDGWDSMNHLRLIMRVEKEFGVQFDTDDIPNLNSYKKIQEKILELS